MHHSPHEIEQVLRKFSFEEFDAKAHLMAKCENRFIEPSTFAAAADARGVVRIMYNAIGGASSNIKTRLQTFLLQHGVPRDAIFERSKSVADACSNKELESIFERHNPWPRIETIGHNNGLPVSLRSVAAWEAKTMPTHSC